ncbi:MAG: hypothetical protein ABGX16_08220 [Pirellulales bacterium]
MALFLVMALLASARLIAAEITLGEKSGYRIELQLIVDTRRRPQPELASHLVDMISQRVDATLSPFWDLTIHVPQGKMRQRLRLLLDSTGPLPVAKDKALPWEEFSGDDLDGDELGEGRSAREKLPDKRMFLSVTALPAGYRLRCCEWDGYVHRWGTIQQRMVSQRSQLAENGFQILREVFAPLAVVHIQAMDDGGKVDGQTRQDQPDRTSRDKQVLLQVKGSQLVREAVGQLFFHAGDVYQPLLRRTDRSGDLSGISAVPWTYLELDSLELDGDQELNGGLESDESLAEDGLKAGSNKPDAGEGASTLWKANIHSGLRRPFGIRLRGRSALLALALRTVETTTSQVRFHARHNPAQALAGYEVFQQLRGNTSSRWLGLTDSHGTITVDSELLSEVQDRARVITLLLRSDGRLLGKIPLVPGAARLVEIPIVDDMARLQAQARLVEVREQLVDLVARRNILLARARQQFSDGHLQQAQDFLDKLNALPSRSQFNQILTTAEKQPGNQSKDPQVQSRIEKSFANARSLLGRSLSSRPLSDLQSEVNLARRNQAPASP